MEQPGLETCGSHRAGDTDCRPLAQTERHLGTDTGLEGVGNGGMLL